MISDALKNEALRLKPVDKINFVEMLLNSLDRPDHVIEAKWVEESEKRYDAYQAGKLKGIPLSDIRDRFEN
ncbi:MAG: addiction module protein [Planctomycetes bacterium]|nr:addiction module protein [Planctomycetota bacterium]